MGGAFNFSAGVERALGDDNLRMALGVMQRGFIGKRAKARERLPEFDDLRDLGRDLKEHVLFNLDEYLCYYEEQVLLGGGHVHWASNSAKACEQVLSICAEHGARVVTKGKSMIGEEIGINSALEGAGIEAVETDLGEYIIQLRGEKPSHIIAPALHVLQDEVADIFRESHGAYTDLRFDRDLLRGSDLVLEARRVLRGKYLRADVGITGANFLVAESGSSVIVTNEGNGDLTQILPRVHIVLASIEKVVANFNDVMVFLRLLARSATGQEMSSYTTFSTGVRGAGDIDGAEHYHVILLDNGRSELLGGERSSVLRCIRCGACMNHCPVYSTIGGHAYGWTYPGPIGASLTPGLVGLSESRDLPHASSFCGRCDEVCPVRIPLTDIMRSWRGEDFASTSRIRSRRWFLFLWRFLAMRSGLYRFSLDLSLRVIPYVVGFRFLCRLPLLRGWLFGRDLPMPQTRKSFVSLYAGGVRGVDDVGGADGIGDVGGADDVGR